MQDTIHSAQTVTLQNRKALLGQITVFNFKFVFNVLLKVVIVYHYSTLFVSREDKGSLNKLIEAVRTNYNDRYEEVGA